MAEEAPKRRGRPPRFSRDELEEARVDARAGIGEPPRLLLSRRAQQNRLYEREGMEVLKKSMGLSDPLDVLITAIETGMEIPFDWWLKHPHQNAALAELGRLETAFPGHGIPIAMLIDRAEPKGAMTAARAIRGFRLGLRRGRQSRDRAAS